MTVQRIELVDPTPEGQRIAEALRAHGLYVVERSIESLRDGTTAAIVILASDGASATDGLRALRAAGGTDVPLLLLGDRTASGALVHETVPHVPSDCVFARPVAVDRLIRKVEAILSPDLLSSQESHPIVPLERTMQFPSRTTARSEIEDGSLAEWKPPERTLELPAEDPPPRPSSPPKPDRAMTSDRPGTSERPMTSERSVRDSAPPSGSVPRAATAVPDDALSPRLRRLMAEADRRVFPSAAPLDLRFGVSDLPVLEIVPDELLDAVSLPIDPVEDDPLDAFTYLGPAPDATSMPSIPEASRPPWVTLPADVVVEAASDESSLTSAESPATFAGRRAEASKPATRPVRDLPFGDPGSQGRRGTLGEGDAIRLLLDVALESRNGRVELTTPKHTLALRVEEGDVVRLEGAVHVPVAARFAREGRLGAIPQSETDAHHALESLVASKVLGRLELERALREERERLLADVLSEPAAQFTFDPDAQGESLPPVLSRPLAGAVLEATRRRFGTARARRLLGAGEPRERRLAFRLDPSGPRVFRRLGLEPELARLVMLGQGEDLDDWLASTADPDALGAVVFVLVCVGAARIGGATIARDPDPLDAARTLVLAAAELAEDADYFAILGVRPDAQARDLREAHAARRQALLSLRFALAPGADRLESARREALDAIDEAYEVLADDRRRSAYRSAIAAPSRH